PMTSGAQARPATYAAAHRITARPSTNASRPAFIASPRSPKRKPPTGAPPALGATLSQRATSRLALIPQHADVVRQRAGVELLERDADPLLAVLVDQQDVGGVLEVPA